jgi:hypothetical protein
MMTHGPATLAWFREAILDTVTNFADNADEPDDKTAPRTCQCDACCRIFLLVPASPCRRRGYKERAGRPTVPGHVTSMPFGWEEARK